MTASIIALTNAVAALVPELEECSRHRDEADSKATLPWMVISVTTQGNETSESAFTHAGHGFLDVRIAGQTSDQVSLFADQCDVTGLTPHVDGFTVGAMVEYSDSGTYSAPLTNDLTSTRVPTRVVRWKFTWSRH